MHHTFPWGFAVPVSTELEKGFAVPVSTELEKGISCFNGVGYTNKVLGLTPKGVRTPSLAGGGLRTPKGRCKGCECKAFSNSVETGLGTPTPRGTYDARVELV